MKHKLKGMEHCPKNENDCLDIATEYGVRIIAVGNKDRGFHVPATSQLAKEDDIIFFAGNNAKKIGRKEVDDLVKKFEEKVVQSTSQTGCITKTCTYTVPKLFHNHNIMFFRIALDMNVAMIVKHDGTVQRTFPDDCLLEEGDQLHFILELKMQGVEKPVVVWDFADIVREAKRKFQCLLTKALSAYLEPFQTHAKKRKITAPVRFGETAIRLLKSEASALVPVSKRQEPQTDKRPMKVFPAHLKLEYRTSDFALWAEQEVTWITSNPDYNNYMLMQGCENIWALGEQQHVQPLGLHTKGKMQPKSGPKMQMVKLVSPTVRLCNISYNLKRKQLQKLLDVRFKGKYDWLYVSFDHVTGCNKGYAFINFKELHYAQQFQSMIHNEIVSMRSQPRGIDAKTQKVNYEVYLIVDNSDIKGLEQLKKRSGHFLLPNNQVAPHHQPIYLDGDVWRLLNKDTDIEGDQKQKSKQ
jgi:hypothetical protein